MVYAQQNFSPIRWFFILIFFFIVMSSGLITTEPLKHYIPFAAIFCLFIVTLWHGSVRYGLRHIMMFFLLTFFISLFFEALSIKTGFPFSFYYYDQLIGPRLFDVPLIIMPTYFGMGYVAWTLAHILLNQYDKSLRGKQLFWIPFVGAMIMVMWDLCVDPILSNVDSYWVWPSGGSYFGVPLQNFFGWFLVVYLIFQIFAFYITHQHAMTIGQFRSERGQLFWLEAVAIYATQALLQLLNPFTQKPHFDIFGPMALITIFTMGFVVIIAYSTIKHRRTSY